MVWVEKIACETMDFIILALVPCDTVYDIVMIFVLAPWK